MTEVVSAAWDKVSEDWDNQARHDAVVQLAVDNNEIKWLAGKYRERKGDAIADAQLVKLTNAAVATMMASATAKRAKDQNAPYRRALVWIVMFVLMLVLGLMAAKLMSSGHHSPPP